MEQETEHRNHWPEKFSFRSVVGTVYAGGKELSTILACFGCSDKDIKIRALSGNHTSYRDGLVYRFPSVLSGASACTLSALSFSNSEQVSNAQLRNHFKSIYIMTFQLIFRNSFVFQLIFHNLSNLLAGQFNSVLYMYIYII